MEDIKERIYSSFARTASTIGYSEVHGRIIAALFVNDKPLTLQKLAEETGYSPSSISLSLDFLEVLGVVSKFKKKEDRKLYIKMQGDLLEALRKAVIKKTENSINEALEEFETYREEIKESKEEEVGKTKEILNSLESELKRLQQYLEFLREVELPR